MAIQQQASRRTRLRKALLIIAGIALAMFGAATGYALLFSMNTARPLEIAGAPTGPQVLIATQGSTFKDAVVTELVDHLKQRSAHIRVIDVATLPDINESDWNVLVIIHTWEVRKPPAQVQAFVDRVQHRDKLVVITTSGAGNFKLEGVDAISAASRMVDVPARVGEAAKRVDAILDAEPTTS